MKRLQRFPSKGYIGGVCHGLGEHTGIDPIIWRFIAIFTPSLWVYIFLWVFLKKGEENGQ